jgi:hypothetical protein
MNPNLPISRREALSRGGLGFGTLALAGLFTDMGLTSALAAATANVSSLAPRAPQAPGRAKRVIHLFMNGGPSQVDTFDPKPKLIELHGKPLPGKRDSNNDKLLAGPALGSKFGFQKHGQSGTEISELFPHVAKHADDLCVVRSMFTDLPSHEQSLSMMNNGNLILPRPCVGSWALYGLGTENQSLPGFVVMCPDGMPVGGAANWRSAFLPGIYQGTHINTKDSRPDQLIANLHNETIVPERQRRQLGYVQKLNELHLRTRGNDPQLDARIQSLELAFRMQTEATDAFDVSKEPQHIREMYGETLQGRQMLMARRLAERGVRYIQVWHGAGQPWDSHFSIEKEHPRLAAECDQPIAALIQDLKNRGMLNDTLVIWGGEFGRTPAAQGPIDAKVGRQHHNDGFTIWMAGGGAKPGYIHGATDELGLSVAAGKVHVHDLHATILHLLGFNHETLTYRYAGREFRLTDVFGEVVHELIA